MKYRFYSTVENSVYPYFEDSMLFWWLCLEKIEKRDRQEVEMIKGLAGLPQNGGKKIENFWAWKSAEEKQKVFKITNKVQQSGIEE